MKRMISLSLLGLLALTGCQTGSPQWPWQKSEPMPPVELLDDSAAKTEEAPAAQAQPAPGASGLALATNSRFKDVPLPAKAKEDLERSYVYESAALQIGRMVYNIRADVNEIARFYNDQCPAAGWALKNVQQATGNVYMLFTKSGKKLEVTVESLGMGRGQRLILHMVPDTAGGEV